jgi:beta-phosphoglucomutase-like phosphatase (HAD superfamily)
VVFDMYGVVVDSELLSITIIAEIISEHGGHVTPALLAGLR